jgi:hypothetical protein
VLLLRCERGGKARDGEEAEKGAHELSKV